ncbi:MAG TPA: hypothetical protein VIG68_03370, partial [Lysobacter sp.]
SDCIMPYLPFTSANLTEIARWTSNDDTTLMVNSGGRLATNPTEPSGGRSYALKSGTAISTATVRNSNSGLAVSTALTFEGVDPTDQSAVSTDQQSFTIGGSVSAPTGADFNVMRTGGGTNPFMFFTVGAETGECFRLASGGRRCSTGSAAPLTGTLKVENYWSETTQTRSFSIGPEQCSVSRKNNDPAFTPQTLSVSDFPVFNNFEVTSAVVGTGTTQLNRTVSFDNTAREYTVIDFAGLAAGAQINLTFAPQAGSPRTDATIRECTVTYVKGKQNAASGYVLSVQAWNRPWE